MTTTTATFQIKSRGYDQARFARSIAEPTARRPWAAKVVIAERRLAVGDRVRVLSIVNAGFRGMEAWVETDGARLTVPLGVLDLVGPLAR